MPLNTGASFLSDDDRWRAIVRRDKNADGRFFYSVRSTGVYCRPSCAARLPRRENVQFHRTAGEAERTGFRACKRCKPDRSEDDRDANAIQAACRLIEQADSLFSIDQLAKAAGLSPSHFHRLFKRMTGLTPKSYANAHRNRRVREALKQEGSVTAAIYEAGYNSNGRFYANASQVLGMTPMRFRQGGAGMRIRFAVGECSLGSILVAVSERGVCAISLGDDPEALVRELQDQFPNAELAGNDREFERWVAQVVAFAEHPAAGLKLPLDVQGTAFQQRVWQKLSEIAPGETRTYSEIARELGAPNATRAVAGACAANRIAIAIPCHRVVRTDGSLSGYRWGVARKASLLNREKNSSAPG